MKVVDSFKDAVYFLVASGWGRILAFATMVFTAFLFGHVGL